MQGLPSRQMDLRFCGAKVSSRCQSTGSTSALLNRIQPIAYRAERARYERQGGNDDVVPYGHQCLQQHSR